MRAHLAFVAFLLLTPAVAQVPDGDYVVSSLWTSALGRGPGGLFLVHPRTPGQPTVVQGLGSDLLGVAAHSGVGASCVTIRGADGALLVGEIAPWQDQVDLHEITLSGATVVRDRTFRIGTAGFSGSGGIAELASLPNGDTLIVVQDLQAGPPLHGARFAIVARNGTVTPVPTPILQDEYPLALAVDPSGTTAYVVVAPNEPHAVHLHAIPLPGGGSAPLVGTFGPILTGLAFDGQGDLIACSTTDLYRVDLARGVLVPRFGLPGVVNSLAAEHASGGFAVIRNDFTGTGSGVHYVDSSGASTLLASSLTGVLSDVAVFDNPRSYGAPTPGTARYTWQVAPAPGGLPRVGNARFGLQVVADGGPLTIGAIFASPAAGRANLFGVHVLLDLNTMWSVGCTSRAGSFALPIPSGVPVGAVLYLQSFHLDAGAPGGIAATEGQRLGLMR